MYLLSFIGHWTSRGVTNSVCQCDFLCLLREESCEKSLQSVSRNFGLADVPDGKLYNFVNSKLILKILYALDSAI